MRSNLLNKIWMELKLSHSIVLYGRLFIDQQKKHNKIYDAIIIIFSSGGAIGTLLSNYFPIIATIIISILSLLKQTSSLILIKNEDIMKMNNLVGDYDKYFSQIQALFEQLKANKIDDEKAQRIYLKLYEGFSKERICISELYGKINKKLEHKAMQQSDQYLRQTYNIPT